MADIPGLRREMAKRTGLSPRHLTRLVTAKTDTDLLPRDIATMAVANDLNVPLGKFVNQEDLASLREAQRGTKTVVQPTASIAAPAQALPAPRRRTATTATRQPNRKKGRDVMVVHGRDEKMKDAMFAFLKALDLRPLEWTSGIRVANPTVQQIVDALFGQASAVVVLLTPDDEARLKPEFHEPHDPPHEVNLTGQARPNVLFEAGMAITSHPDRTVMVQIGQIRPFTDIGGSYITHMNNSLAKRKELVAKLAHACAVDTSGEDWRDSARGGDFEIKKGN